MKYKINNQNIELIERIPNNSLHDYGEELFNELTDKINELIKALGEPVEENPKLDKNNLKEGDKYWFVDDNVDVDEILRLTKRGGIITRLTDRGWQEEAADYRRKILGK